MEFLSMIWANIQQLAAMGIHSAPMVEKLGGKKVKTKYDKEQDEILLMMMRWLPSYMNELRTGSYAPPKRLKTMLRHIFQRLRNAIFFLKSFLIWEILWDLLTVAYLWQKRFKPSYRRLPWIFMVALQCMSGFLE